MSIKLTSEPISKDDDGHMTCPHCGYKFKKKFTDFIDLEEETSSPDEREVVIVCVNCCKPILLQTEVASISYVGIVEGIERKEWDKYKNRETINVK